MLTLLHSRPKAVPFPNTSCPYLHQLLGEACHAHADHPNEAPEHQCFKQTSRQTRITHKVMFSSIPRETYFKELFFFLNKCVLSCMQINLVGSSSFSPHCSHACLSCSQRVGRNSPIHIKRNAEKKLMQSSGDRHLSQ